jgi:hypothetical protein
MLTFRSLGRKGNLGNQLFQIASTVGIAQVTGHQFVFPEWQYGGYFEYELPVAKFESLTNFIQVVEEKYGYHRWCLTEGNFDINGALQSEKYFEKDFTRQLFRFKSSFLSPLLISNAHLFENNPIFISVRRGDFVYHPHYYQLPYRYYFLALTHNFKDWKERNLVFMSDDIGYCKFHFGFLKNAVFVENLSAIEQLAIASQGIDFIISNSTFSWWMAWMAEKKESKIIRPIKNFRGTFAVEHDDSDYFPSRWKSFDFKRKNIGLLFFWFVFKGTLFQILNFSCFCLIKTFKVLKGQYIRTFKLFKK